MNDLYFNEDYTGPRWTYGMIYRPLSIGAQPKGFIIGSVKPHDGFNHGTVDYPRELTRDEVESYQLERVVEPAP
jgi:hypothetical protein